MQPRKSGFELLDLQAGLRQEQPPPQSSSFWDQPLLIPAVLYRRLGLPPPPEVEEALRRCPNRELMPQTLLDYVARAYAPCQAPEEYKIIESALKKKIQEAKSYNTLEAIDWEHISCPQLRINANPQPYPPPKFIPRVRERSRHL